MLVIPAKYGCEGLWEERGGEAGGAGAIPTKYGCEGLWEGGE